jgi:SsrA-binding protein
MPAKQKKKTKQPLKDAGSGPYIKMVSDNRRARFNYDLSDHIEAGIVLSGTEIKSIRAGRSNIRDAYAQVRDGEMWLQNMHISQWTSAGPWNHDPVHPRRLLLHRAEIDRMARLANQKGLTIIPMRIYIKGHVAKVEVALAKGRRRYDKRKAIQQRETDREIGRAIRREA